MCTQTKMEILYDNIYELEIECTTLCNASCPLCYRNYKSFLTSPYSKPLIRDFNSVIEQLNKLKNLNYVMLVGSMSEPTLYPKFIELVKYLKNRNIKIEICTNGDTHNSDFWKELAMQLSDDDEIYFTICGSTQELHEQYRKNTCLKNILTNANAVRQIRPIDYAQCIRFSYNNEDFNSQAFKKLVSQFSHVYMTETFYQKDISNYNVKFDQTKFLPNPHKLAMYDKLKAHAEKSYKLNKSLKTDCMCLRYNRYQIDVFGNIYPCYLFLEYSNGNIWDQNTEELKFVNHECCKFCEKYCQMYANRYSLDYII